jgi:hypothetical protein
MMSLLDSFFIYNQIKVKMEDAFKTTLITHWGALTYERNPFVLSVTSTTFKKYM